MFRNVCITALTIATSLGMAAPLTIDFEHTGPYTIEDGAAGVTAENPLTGASSLLIDTTKNDGEWIKCLRTTAGTLKPDTDYLITLSFRVLAVSNDSTLIFLVRPLDAEHNRLDLYTATMKAAGKTELLTIMFRTPKEPGNYALQIHTRKKVRALVDDITIIEGGAANYPAIRTLPPLPFDAVFNESLRSETPGAMDTVKLSDNGAALVNPGMGWVFHYYDNSPNQYGSKLAPSDTVDDFPGLSVIYLRIAWSYLEPEEGRFNWSVLDTPAARWIAKGKKIAFRITACETGDRYATPPWVAKAGARGYRFSYGRLDTNGTFWEPDYNDPIFLEKLDNFIKAFAARYDGSPDVAFVDLGSFGVWGEGHLGWSTRLKYTSDVVIRHMDIYRKHFKKTLLAVNDDHGEDAVAYGATNGFTLRDDSILVESGKRAYYHDKMAAPFWPNVPVILESEHYGGSRDKGNWKDGSLYLKAVEDYHASYVSIHWWPHEFYNECRDLITSMNQRIGYRLMPAEVSFPKTIYSGGAFAWEIVWKNTGVAPCYPGGYPALTFKDTNGGITGVFVDNAFNVKDIPADMKDIAAGVREKARSLVLPMIAQGTYDVYISVGDSRGTPVIALPLSGDDGSRRYRVGKITVGKRGWYSASAVMTGNSTERALRFTFRQNTPLPAGTKLFCHFDNNGKIAFQAFPKDDFTAAELTGKPSSFEARCPFTIPSEARGRTFTVNVGLWLPGLNERIPAENDAGDRRVKTGTLAVGTDGTAIFTPVE